MAKDRLNTISRCDKRTASVSYRESNRNSHKLNHRGVGELERYDLEHQFATYEHLSRQHTNDHTTAWMECRMFELRERASNLEKMCGRILISMDVDFIHQAPFFFPDQKIHFATFYIPSRRLDIELESAFNQTSCDTAKRQVRDERFKLKGIRIVRIPTDEYKDKIALTEAIEVAMNE